MTRMHPALVTVVAEPSVLANVLASLRPPATAVVQAKPRRDDKTAPMPVYATLLEALLSTQSPDTKQDAGVVSPRIVATLPTESPIDTRLLDTLISHHAAFELRPAGAPAGPLAGCRVTVTRPLDSSGPLVAALFGQGAHVIVAPCLAVAGPPDPEALDATLRMLSRFRGVILSSPIAVQVVAEQLRARGTSLAAIPSLLAVIGRSTAQRCREVGREPDIVARVPRSEGLVAELDACGELSRAWLHLRADEGRDVLSQAFTQAGGTLRVVEAYATTMPTWPPALSSALVCETTACEMVVITSGKAGRYFFEELGRSPDTASKSYLGRVRVVSIGPTTTDALERQGHSVANTAASPSDIDLVRACGNVARGLR